MPVRVRIHSSLVSTIFSRSALVITFGGTYPATPVIFAAMRWDITLLANCFPKQKNLNLMRLRRGVTRRSPVLVRCSSESQEVTQFDEEQPAGGIVWRALCRYKRRSPGMQREVAVTIVIAKIHGRSGMQQICQKHIGRKLLSGRDGPSVETAEVGLQIQQAGVGDCCVVVQNQPQRQFFRELVIQLRAIQVIIENALPGRKRRGYPACARSQAVINQRLIKSEACGRPQR